MITTTDDTHSRISVENTQPRMEWRCFHCGHLATTETDAREHFGLTMDYQTACQGDGGMWGQRLRHHVKSLLNGLDTGAVKITSDQDETLARDLSFMRFAVDHFQAQTAAEVREPRTAAGSLD
jgi:LPS sulfotransferase NodH